MGRDNRLDTTRCLCNYLVVGYHAATVGQFCHLNPGVRFFCLVFCYMALPTLFFISGYLVASSCERMPFRTVVLRKAKRLLIPYFSWNLLLLLVYYCLDVYRDRVTWAWLCNPLAPSLDGPLWFLRSLFILSIVAPILIWLVRHGVGAVVGMALIVWCFFTSIAGEEQRLVVSFPSYSLMAFFAGLVFWMKRMDPFLLCSRGLVWPGVLIMFLWFGAVDMFDIRHTCLYWFARTLCFVAMIPVALWVGNLLHLKMFGHGAVGRRLIEGSFFVYAAHIFISPIFSHGMNRVLPYDFMGKDLFLAGAYVFGGVLGCLILFYLTQRFCPLINGMLDGRPDVRWRRSEDFLRSIRKNK